MKLNCLTGERQGYPSSMTYLMMFLNYCQTCYILPNMQRHPKPKEKDSDPLYTQYKAKEKLSTKEQVFIKRMLSVESLAGGVEFRENPYYDVTYYHNNKFDEMQE